MQIIPRLSGGGAEQGCIDIARSARERGWTSLVVTQEGDRIPEVLRAKVEVIILPVARKNPVTLWLNQQRLRTLIRSRGVDLVHARSRAPAWSAEKAVRGTPAHFLTTAHNAYRHSNAAKKAYNAVMARGERVIAISHYVADHLRREFELGEDRVRVVQRGISMKRFHPSAVTPDRMIALAREWRLPDGASVVMMPGRITRWKGQHVFLKALHALNRPDVFALLVGGAAQHDRYAAQLQKTIETHLPGRVRIVGHCADMPAAYMLSNVVVSSSILPEGFGRIAVEAQAMGRPLIATRGGGANETVRDGTTGFLVDPGDADAMAAALGRVLTLSAQERADLSHRAMDHVSQNFSLERMIDQTFAVYDEILSSQPSQQREPA